MPPEEQLKIGQTIRYTRLHTKHEPGIGGAGPREARYLKEPVAAGALPQARQPQRAFLMALVIGHSSLIIGTGYRSIRPCFHLPGCSLVPSTQGKIG